MLGLAVAVLYGAALLGWGEVLGHIMRLPSMPAGIRAALGLALIVFFGGLLNLFGLAKPWAISAIGLSGIAIAAWRALVATRSRLAEGPLYFEAQDIILGVVILAILGLTLAFTIPPAAFNYADDFQKYFAFPVRMIETGTLAGEPLSGLGQDTIGGQAFLQAATLLLGPIQYLPVLDNLVCFAACLWLAATIGASNRLPLYLTLTALGLLVVIESQTVNISANYSAVLLLMSSFWMLGSPEFLEKTAPWQRAALVGILLAALLALKTTFLPLAASLLLVFGGAVLVTSRRASVAARSTLMAGGALLGFLLPWLLVYRQFLLDALFRPVSQPPIGPGIQQPFDLFSLERMALGGAPLGYLLALVLPIMVAFIALGASRSASSSVRTAAGNLAALSTTVAVVLVPYLWPGGDMLSGEATSLRYYIPVVIASSVSISLLAWSLLERRAKSGGTLRHASAALAVIVIAVFLPSAAARFDQMRAFHNTLMLQNLGENPAYTQFVAQALSADAKSRVQKIQAAVPTGAPILAWMVEPFFLDWTRNPISLVNLGGLNTRWSRIPKVQYLIWQHDGPGVLTRDYLTNRAATVEGAAERRATTNMLLFEDLVVRAVEKGEVVYEDGQIMVLRLSAEGLPERW